MRNKYLSFTYSILAVVIPIIIFFELLFINGYVPLFTNSISFDAKIKNIQEKKIKQIDVLAIGSSITLNNLSSMVIKDSINLPYYNFSSWGLQMSDIKQMVINYLPKYRPRYLIICSSVPDFEDAGNAASINNYLNTNEYCKEHLQEYFYIKNYNSILDIRERKNNYYKLKSEKDDYDYLGFDDYGGVLLNIPKDRISVERWSTKGGFPTTYTDRQYNELISLGKLLKDQNILLVFVQSPIKKLYVSTSKEKQIVEAHFNKCKAIVEKYNGIYLNSYYSKEFEDDNMFVDQFHLSSSGAILFTKEFVHCLKQMNYFHN